MAMISGSISTSFPSSINSPQSDWALELAKYLQQIGQDQMAWAMQECARAGAVTDAQINNYIATANQGSNLAGGLLGRYNDLYGPMTDQYAREAGTYASAPRLLHEMGRAESGVMQAGRQAELNAEQELQSFGIDPSSGRYQDLVRASQTANAAAAAGAGETARRQVEQEGMRRREAAINMGQQLPGAAVNAMNATYQGIAGAENSALGLANTGVNLTTSPAKFLDPAMSLKYPPVGQTSQSLSQSPTGGGGGGGGRGGVSDPFNSDRFGRGGGGAPAMGGATPGGPGLPNGIVGNKGQYRSPSVIEPAIDEGQAYGGARDVEPWDQASDPYSWGGQGGQGITAERTGGYFDGRPAAPDWWNTGATPAAPESGGWWESAGQQDAGWNTPAWNDYSGVASGGDSYGGDYSGGYDEYYAGGGGVVPQSMSPSGGQEIDDVQATIPQTGGQARLNVDEFVIPRDVALWKGQEYFQKMIAQSRKARLGAPAQPQRG